jgi:diguanylate cyclase (GGDEF)-like protein/PAS domain S-box-containing protein
MADTTDQSLLYRLLLEALPFGVYAVNRDGKVILWSAGAEQLTGYLRQEMIGRRHQDTPLVHCDDHQNPIEGTTVPLAATLREGHFSAAKVSLRTKNGELLPVEIRTLPLRDDHAVLIGAAEIIEGTCRLPTDERRQSKLAAYGCLDSLTGVLNHTMVQAHLRETLSLHVVYPVPSCVMCFSVDGLEELRKRYGQAGADAALRTVAQAIEHGLRPTDFVGRWLNYEFLAILSECNQSDVIRVGERLGRLVRNTETPWWGDKLSVTISMGATPILDNDTVGSIVGRAEHALRQSTDAGGNRVMLVAS